jgi:hypothetical protein
MAAVMYAIAGRMHMRERLRRNLSNAWDLPGTGQGRRQRFSARDQQAGTNLSAEVKEQACA